MSKLVIKGGKLLEGTINISGAKNSAVALLPASILSDDIVTIENVPNISDIDSINEILKFLNCNIKYDNHKIMIDSKNIINKEIPEDISSKLRASYYFMSALLGKFKKVTMYFPGGCSIGARPIDQTLKAYKALGATVIEKNNKFIITADELIGANINLDMPSVGATINAILVSVKAKGTTIINNAAKEPEIVNLADLLNNMGANIKGAGTSKIIIEGVKKLSSGNIKVIPDRIEAGTYLILGALIGKNLKIDNLSINNIQSLLDIFDKMGVNYIVNNNSITINKYEKLNPVTIKTDYYPGFATDLQQPLTALLTYANGISQLTENLYENRFKNISYLNTMGANIEKINDRVIKIKGPTVLLGTELEATDLRAGACLVLAALSAQGKSTISNISHVLRGYEDIVNKLKNVNADIELIEE